MCWSESHISLKCPPIFGTPNPKFYFDLLLFHLVHGLTRPYKTPKNPKKGLKLTKKKLYLPFLKYLPKAKKFPYFI